MTSLGESLASLPLPIGPIVTGLLPVIAIVAVLAAAYLYRKGRRVASVVLMVVGLGALTGAISFYAFSTQA
jgi:hypothetical protein